MQDGDFGSQNRVLTSWKEIAAYLGKGVRTVQRWEKDFGLPIRRPHGSDKSAILARTRDLDAWVAMRCSTREEPGDGRREHDHLLSICTSLVASINTSLMLRESNAQLLSEVKSALSGLRSEIMRMHAGTQQLLVNMDPTFRAKSLAPPSSDDLPSAGAA